MSKKAHVEEHEEEGGGERWLLTYSDMITLLMVLFIVLFALGQTNIRKFNAFKASFHTTAIQPAPVMTGGIGVLQADNSIGIKPPTFRQLAPSAKSIQQANSQTTQPYGSSGAGSASALAEDQRALERALRRAGYAGDVRFRSNESGLAVTIATDRILFTSGSAQLLPAGEKVIAILAPVLARLSNDLEIQGHTDNQPISGQYASNWELSTARATAVLEYLLTFGISPDRLSASGYGDTRPLVPKRLGGQPGQEPPGRDRRPVPSHRILRGVTRGQEEEG